MNEVLEQAPPPGFDLASAMAEANRCLLCHDAPCSKACPAETDPGTFIRKLRLQNITGAIRTVMENNILGGSCGALCPTSRLCEQGCCAAGLDRPVRIGRIQRFLVEHGRAIGFNPLQAGASRSDRVAVLGAGPAGLSCAAELTKAGCQVTVFERSPAPGGQLRYGVPEFRYPTDLLQQEIADVERLGVEIRCSSPVEEAEALLGQGYNAIFLAPGLAEPTPVLAQTAPERVIGSGTFLEAFRSERAGEMASLVRDRRVAVICGGSVAIDCAESALRHGARETTIIYRRGWLQMPATTDEKVAVLEAGIHLLVLQQPVRYVADVRGGVCGVEMARTRLGAPDPSGRAGFERIPSSEWLLDVDVVIEAAGQRAAENSPRWYPTVGVRSDRRIVTDGPAGATSVPGVFAGGDIVRGPALVVDAVGDGKRAARAILSWLDQPSN